MKSVNESGWYIKDTINDWGANDLVLSSIGVLVDAAMYAHILKDEHILIDIDPVRKTIHINASITEPGVKA